MGLRCLDGRCRFETSGNGPTPDADVEEGIGKVVEVVDETVGGSKDDMLDTTGEIVAIVMRSSVELDVLEFEGLTRGDTVAPSFEGEGTAGNVIGEAKVTTSVEDEGAAGGITGFEVVEITPLASESAGGKNMDQSIWVQSSPSNAVGSNTSKLSVGMEEGKLFEKGYTPGSDKSGQGGDVPNMLSTRSNMPPSSKSSK